MNNKSGDRFETNNRNLFFNKNEENNFFLSDNTAKISLSEITEPARRLNDYDFNLLREDAYKDVSDDLFKLEYKISKVEEEIKSLDLQIQAAKDIQDYELAGELSGRRIIMNEDYETLVSMYKDKSISAKITNVFGEKFKPVANKLQTKVYKFIETMSSFMPKRFSSVLELKKSLNRLENISRSVDELVSLNIPYGEQIDKYEQLSKYIIKANSIQNEISGLIK